MTSNSDKKPELLPCPFCRETPYSNEATFSVHTYVYCDRCSFDVRIETWNRRPLENNLRAEVERYRDALQEIIGGVDYYEEPDEAKFIAEKALLNKETGGKERE